MLRSLLRPKPLDAWVLATALLFVVAALGSGVWHIRSENLHPLDLTAPLVGGILGVLSGIAVVSLHHRIGKTAIALFLSTIVGAITLHFIGGRLLGVRSMLYRDEWTSIPFEDATVSDWLIA